MAQSFKEREKPAYMVSMTANDSYEQDMLQHRLANSGDPEHQQVAETMEKTFHFDPRQQHQMQPGEEYALG